MAPKRKLDQQEKQKGKKSKLVDQIKRVSF